MTATTRALDETSGRMKRETPKARRDAPEEQDALQRAHGAEEHRPGEADEAEGRDAGAVVPTPADCQPEKKWCQLRRPRRQRSQLAHQRQRPEEQLAGPDGDDHQGDHHRHGALATGAERGGADFAPEAVPPGAASQVVELVEVGVLAEGQPTLPVNTATCPPLVLARRSLTRAATALAASRPWWERRLRYRDSRALPCSCNRRTSESGNRRCSASWLRSERDSPRRRAFHRHAPGHGADPVRGHGPTGPRRPRRAPGAPPGAAPGRGGTGCST